MAQDANEADSRGVTWAVPSETKARSLWCKEIFNKSDTKCNIIICNLKESQSTPNWYITLPDVTPVLALGDENTNYQYMLFRLNQAGVLQGIEHKKENDESGDWIVKAGYVKDSDEWNHKTFHLQSRKFEFIGTIFPSTKAKHNFYDDYSTVVICNNVRQTMSLQFPLNGDLWSDHELRVGRAAYDAGLWDVSKLWYKRGSETIEDNPLCHAWMTEKDVYNIRKLTKGSNETIKIFTRESCNTRAFNVIVEASESDDNNE